MGLCNPEIQLSGFSKCQDCRILSSQAGMILKREDTIPMRLQAYGIIGLTQRLD